jgi:hypothetical protein
MSGRVRKFAVRVLAVLLVLFGPMLAVIGLVALFPSTGDGIARLLGLFSGVWLMSALLLSPAILFPHHGPGDLPGPPGGGGGGGDDPPEPPIEPSAPRGGLPLPDAEQSRERIRDHGRPGRRGLGERRPAREPQRLPARTPADE